MKNNPLFPVARPVAIRGSRLRELRESKGIDIPTLAKRLTLSSAQLRQLEQNETTLFYSDAIRLAAARKVADFLGEPLQFEPAPEDSEAVPTQPAASNPLPRISQTVGDNRSGRFEIQLSGWSFALGSVVLGFGLLLVLQLSMAFTPSPESALTEENGADNALSNAVVVLAAEVQQPGEAATSLGAVALVDSQVPAAGANAAPDKPALVADIVGSRCAASNGPIANFSPTKEIASKAATHVFVKGEPGQVVCVRDGQGKVWHHEFDSESGRNFQGSAPWLLESSQLMSLQIYFQGTRARAVQPGVTRLRLVAAEPA